MMPALPEPIPTDVSRPHWDGCRRHELLVQRCRRCRRYVFTPEVRCPACRSELDWVRSSGRGSVYSYTVVWRPQTPEFEVPYVPAVIELEEGWTMFSRVVGCPPEHVAVGLPVEVSFREVSGRTTLPEFRPEGM